MEPLHCHIQLTVPDGRPPEEALARTTHLGIGAHPDDLEIMCWDGVLECFRRPMEWFTGITVTDGRGSPRGATYAHFDDDDMVAVRQREQQSAAFVGEYSAMACLRYTSAQAKGGAGRENLIDDLETLLRATRPKVIYTHNLADKHATHVAVVTAVIAALRRLPQNDHPELFYGCEVWRGLDWMLDEDKQCFDVSAHQGLTNSLVGLYDTQLSGGKRYDLATSGRKRANATYSDAYSTDKTTHLEIAMDLKPLLTDLTLKPADYVRWYLERFAQDVLKRLEGFS